MRQRICTKISATAKYTTKMTKILGSPSRHSTAIVKTEAKADPTKWRKPIRRAAGRRRGLRQKAQKT